MKKLKEKNFITSILIISDAIFLVLAFFISYFLRNKWFLNNFLEQTQTIEIYLIALPFAVITLLFIFNFFGLFQYKKRVSRLNETMLLFKAISFWIICIMAGSYLVKFDYSRIIIIQLWFWSIIFIGLGRILSYKLQLYLGKKGIGLTNILIVGTNKQAAGIAERLKEYTPFNFRFLGFVSRDAETESFKNQIVFGQISELYNLIERLNVKQVYVAEPALSYEEIINLVHNCPRKDIEFKIASNVFSLVQEFTPLSDLEKIPSLDLKKTNPSWLYHFTKRLMDIIASLCGLIILSPLFLIIPWLIKRDSPGPAMFTQNRTGLNGKEFLLYKYRSMRTDVDKYSYAPSEKGDNRITKIGHFLRRASLDEIPQLINILKGEMSVVGPRPEMPFIVKSYTPWQRRRLTVKPGLTGLWQILGRKDIPLHENLEYDFYYINNQSILLDIIIILKTFQTVVSGTGAF